MHRPSRPIRTPAATPAASHITAPLWTQDVQIQYEREKEAEVGVGTGTGALMWDGMGRNVPAGPENIRGEKRQDASSRTLTSLDHWVHESLRGS